MGFFRKRTAEPSHGAPRCHCGEDKLIQDGSGSWRCPRCGMTITLGNAKFDVSGDSHAEVLEVAKTLLGMLGKDLSNSCQPDPGGSHRQTTDCGEALSPSAQEQAAISQHEGQKGSSGITVFVSHSTQDAVFVENELIPHLRANGLDPWYSKDGIRSADHWERRILAALNKCQWFLIVLSPRAAESEWVKDELHWAVTNRARRIIPVMYEDCCLQDFHIRLSRIEYVDYRQDIERARRRVIEAFGREGAGNVDDAS